MPSGQPASGPSKKKKMLLLVGMALVLVLGGLGTVFGLYLPNQPDNVYKTGMDRTGKALNTLVTDVTAQSQLDKLKKVQMTGTASGSYQGMSFAGTLDAKAGPHAVNGTLSVTATPTGQASQTYSVGLIANQATGSNLPDLFFKLSGFKQLGLDAFVPGISSYDGKWLSVSAAYLQSLGLSMGSSGSSSSKDTFTSADATELAKTASNVTSQYLFTADPAKAVFVKKSFVGKEKVDGLSTYHYTVTISNDHLKAYCTQFVNDMYATTAFKHLQAQSAQFMGDKQDALDSCKTVHVSSSTALDVWIDSKYKMVHKVRIPDTTNKSNYVDIGQTYTGGDSVSLFVNFHDGEQKVDANISMDLDTKADTATTKVHAVSSDPASAFKLDASVSLKPYNGTIDTTAPAGAVPIKDVLTQLGLGNFNPAELFVPTLTDQSLSL
ncbi:MAG TPA: hypothetical protein VLH84_05440 [Patescibacteria group bacterium]|nr:hypothetical protein [Patescibacteria group bacterium]